ncbi:hypothetical protein Q3V22_09425, partial [Acinetobacter baumannii]|nr:hypothetical protein [Acinetobacter baumannii]
INESAIIGRPVGCTISFRSRFIHFEIIGLNKPYRLGLCNKAFVCMRIVEKKTRFERDISIKIFCLQSHNLKK